MNRQQRGAVDVVGAADIGTSLDSY